MSAQPLLRERELRFLILDPILEEQQQQQWIRLLPRLLPVSLAVQYLVARYTAARVFPPYRSRRCYYYQPSRKK